MSRITAAALLGFICAGAVSTPSRAQMDMSAHDHHEIPASMPMEGQPSMPTRQNGSAIPADHPADRFFDPARMEAARQALRQQHGGNTYSMVMIDMLEYRFQAGRNTYTWDAEAWYGGDIHKFVAKTKGEGEDKGSPESAEVEALYSRAIGPYFNLQAGLRYDFEPHPKRGFAVIGVEGLAPYWFEVNAHTFVSNKGDITARLEATHDTLLTQKLILQPHGEINLSAQRVPELDIGSGLTTIEAGLRLRYEIKREFAPYVGVFYERKVGGTATFARTAGHPAAASGIMVGVRAWF